MSKPDPRDAIVDHLPNLRAFAYSLTHNGADADDLVQDAVVKAWRKFHLFEEGSNLQAWLFTILRNTFYSDLRRLRRETVGRLDDVSQLLSEKPRHDSRLAMRDFDRAFALLPPEQREVLMLVGASGMTYEEAAELCNVPMGTIKSRINRGRARLHELLGTTSSSDLTSSDKATAAVVMGWENPRSASR